jgi:Zn finger protein HypA/HybF involved in hydrogenase expression
MGRPGEYAPDTTEGITRVEDLPPPHVEHRSRHFRRRKCPRCGRSAPRCNQGQRTLHDLGNVRTGRPIDIVIAYSKHRCPDCRRCFNADMADLALPKCHYTL